MKPVRNHTSGLLRGIGIRFWCLLSASFLIVLLSVSSADLGGGPALGKGKKDLDAGRYQDALGALLLAQKEFPLLEDYTLYYLADAHRGLGDHAKSLETLRLLLGKYPDSPLKKKARMAEVREAKEAGGGDVPALYAAYVRDIPEDEEIRFAYGLYLKSRGEDAEAEPLFKQIYIGAGHLSNAAFAELRPSRITDSDILERASNLMKQYDFIDAEKELKQLLSRCSVNNRHEVMRNLAHALFRQKKYHEAAETYGKTDDTFYKARSLYRAGDKKGFESALESMISRNDSRAGFLLIAVAGDRRRDKDYEEALRIYQDVLRDYPSEAEDALWGIGWTQYRSGDYKKAAETFSRLQEKYDDPKYVYWKARSMETAGEDASGLYTKLAALDNTFYALAAYAKSGKAALQPASYAPSSESAPEQSRARMRIEALISLDMRSDAILELTSSCRNLSSPSELTYIASKFQELGEFKRAISVAARMPYSERVHSFWYPLAFRETVEQASKKYGMDPLIVLSVIREESRFDPSAKSPAGAYGLMQLMPQTAYRLDRDLNLGVDRPSQLMDAGSNIHLGTYYLKSLLEEFHSYGPALAAYNAGEGAVRTWQKQGYRSADEFIEDIPYQETRNYVKKVLASYFQYLRGTPPGDRDSAGMTMALGKL